VSASSKSPWWARLSGAELDGAAMLADQLRLGGETDRDFRDRLALALPRPDGVRGLADRWAAHAGGSRLAFVDSLPAPLDSHDRAALLGWVRRRMAEYARKCPAHIYGGWRHDKPGHADDMAGWIAADLGLGEDLDDDEAIALAKPLCEEAGWPDLCSAATGGRGDVDAARLRGRAGDDWRDPGCAMTQDEEAAMRCLATGPAWTAEIAELLDWTMTRTVSVLQGLVHRGLVQWGYTQSGAAHEGCWRIDRKAW
jgi:hypothetical protein